MIKNILHYDQQNRRVIIILICITLLAILCLTGFSSKSSHPSYEHRYYLEITIEDGDTVWDLAKQHKPKEYSNMNDYIKDIEATNKIQADSIRPGMNLLFPQYPN